MTSNESSNQTINYTRSDAIMVPAPASERRFAVRVKDWDRIKKRLSTQIPKPCNLQFWYSLLFGAGATALSSVIPLQQAKDLSAWVVPAYVCIGVSSVLVGAVFAYVDNRLDRSNRSIAAEVCQDMKDIEATLREAEPPEMRDR